MTLEEILSRPTAPIPDVGREFFGLGRNASYEAAKRGDFETVEMGGRKLAIVAPLARRFGLRTRFGRDA